MEEASGKDLAAWSKAWLETAGPNVLRCEFTTDPGGLFTEFAVVQEASDRHPVLRRTVSQSACTSGPVIR